MRTSILAVLVFSTVATSGCGDSPASVESAGGLDAVRAELSANAENSNVNPATADATRMGGVPTEVMISNGQVCNVYVKTPVWKYKRPEELLYTIPPGGGFRVVEVGAQWSKGHGNGHSDGFINSERIDSSTCHF